MSLAGAARAAAGWVCSDTRFEPKSGFEPDPPAYEAGARPFELRGQIARGARGYAPARAGGVAPAEGIEPSSSRLTAGCLTIRRRWNVSLDAHEHAAADSACPSSRGRRNGEAVTTHVRVERKVGAEFSENEDRMQMHTDTDPGTGVEPVFLGPEPSVFAD